MRRFFAIGVSMVLAGCAGVSKEECLYADWRAIGYEDGAAGRPVSAVTPLRTACARKAGVTVDMNAYMAGREKGLKNYCRPSNGYAIGANGGRYFGVCPSAEDGGFLVAFEAGRGLFELEQTVAAIEHDIHAAEQALHDAQRQITATQAALISPETRFSDRPALLLELKDIDREKDELELALVALHNKLIRADVALADYRARLAFEGPSPNGAVAPTPAEYR